MTIQFMCVNKYVLLVTAISTLNFQPIKRKTVGEEKRMTQEEMLLEAAQTGAPIGTPLYYCFFIWLQGGAY